MKIKSLSIVAIAAATLGACTTTDDDVYVAPAPPVGAGAIVGTVAADRDGDGVVDGYYDANGNYFAYQAPPCPVPPAPPQVNTYGERG